VYEARVEAANRFGWSNKSKLFYLSTSSRGIPIIIYISNARKNNSLSKYSLAFKGTVSRKRWRNKVMVGYSRP
jgi:hypothetical protein